MYADLHSFPAAFAYDFVRLREEEVHLPKHPWAIPPSKPQRLLKPKGQAGYSQTDLAKCIRSNTRLVFASLSPIEKGFFIGVKGSSIDKQFIIDLHDRWHNEGDKATCNWLIAQLKHRAGIEKISEKDLQFLCSRSMNLQAFQVKKMQNGHYDYFEALKHEYGFFLERSGRYTTSEYPIQIDSQGIPRKWQGAYTLAANGNEIDLDPNEDDIIIVPTIGGIHSLGIGNPEDADLRPGQAPNDVDIATLKHRIRQIKGEEPLENGPVCRWQHKPFYITFASHFFNTLCGHAKSFPKPASILFDQRKGQNLGVLSGCIEIWRELLGLTHELEPSGSARILIDVHYMSAAARFEYYKNIIYPFNQKHKDNPIPVIASHAAYAGTDYLQNLIDRAKKDPDKDISFDKGFLTWDINLTDEDILQIFHSQGLLGLSLDNLLLGGGSQTKWLDKVPFSPLVRRRNRNLIKRTLMQFVRTPFDYHVHNPHTIWQRLALGSGFDGFMQPMNRYNSVLQFSTFESDLIQILDEMKREEPVWFAHHRSEDLARMICFDNAYEFVKKHY